MFPLRLTAIRNPRLGTAGFLCFISLVPLEPSYHPLRFRFLYFNISFSTSRLESLICLSSPQTLHFFDSGALSVYRSLDAECKYQHYHKPKNELNIHLLIPSNLIGQRQEMRWQQVSHLLAKTTKRGQRKYTLTT
jgi:hypothetical protein